MSAISSLRRSDLESVLKLLRETRRDLILHCQPDAGASLPRVRCEQRQPALSTGWNLPSVNDRQLLFLGIGERSVAGTKCRCLLFLLTACSPARQSSG